MRRALLLVTLALSAVLALTTPPSAHAWTPGGALDTPFPRLADWCPDVRQPLPSIARYDYVALYDGDRAAVPGLRASNPDIVLLNFTSAVEVHIDHELLLHLPNAWFLTQVGSRLTAAVSATATTFPVADTTVFRAGQLVVVGEELAQVVSVGTGKVVVKRGMVPERTPATAHAVGTRVAAVVGNRPNEIEMDISTYCPQVTVDPLVGPETWAGFAARLQAQRCASADWDGVIADRVEGGESYLVSSGIVQSIDPTRSNTRVKDGYAAFDKAWDAGIRGYEEAVRGLIGPKELLVANNGSANGDLVNGSNLEGFPRFHDPSVSTLLQTGAYTPYWRKGRSFYQDWIASGLQPNFSTLMAYEDEYTQITGKATVPAGPPDYRKMRFGLGTALMGDGFFAYQLAVWGSRTGLYWFDEYDDAGKGKGYLGKPLGASRLALPPLATPDALGGDGAFADPADLDAWRVYSASGYAASKALDSGAARVSVGTSSGSPVGVNLFRESVPVKTGSRYTVSFRARAEKATKIRVRVSMSTSPWKDWVAFYDVEVGPEWRDFELSGISKGTDTASRLMFDLGASVNTVWLDDVKVQGGSRTDVHRRDFTGGLALVNGSDTTMTIPLGGLFRKIKGTQVPAVNDGTLVSSVSLPPRDGLVLLREPLVIDGGDASTRSTTVPIDSDVPGATQMRVSTDGGKTWSAWKPYTPEMDVSLGSPVASGQPGQPETVIVEYRHTDGSSTTASATITLLPAVKGLRLSGADRYATSVAVADKSHPGSAPVVVLASGTNYPDALCAAPLAVAYGGPVLLTPPTYLKASVAKKIQALRPSTVFIVGGPGAVSDSVKQAVARLPWAPRVVRLGGASRYATAAIVAEQVRVKRGKVSQVVVANGKTYSDALLAAPMAAAKGWPILLVTPTVMPAPTSASVAALKRHGLASALVVGDTSHVSATVQSALGLSAERVAGADAYDLSRAMAAYALKQGASTRHLAIATGLSYPDALASGPLLARGDPATPGSGFGILLFSTYDAKRPDSVPAKVSTWLSSRRSDPAIADVTAIGGTGVVSDGNLATVLSLLE